MNEQTFYNDLLLFSFLLAVIVFIALFFFAAPYGRHVRKGWGPSVRNKLAWVVMEAPSPLFFAVCFLIGNNHSIVPLVFLGIVGSPLRPPRFYLSLQSARGQTYACYDYWFWFDF